MAGALVLAHPPGDSGHHTTGITGLFVLVENDGRPLRAVINNAGIAVMVGRGGVIISQFEGFLRDGVDFSVAAKTIVKATTASRPKGRYTIGRDAAS